LANVSTGQATGDNGAAGSIGCLQDPLSCAKKLGIALDLIAADAEVDNVDIRFVAVAVELNIIFKFQPVTVESVLVIARGLRGLLDDLLVAMRKEISDKLIARKHLVAFVSLMNAGSAQVR
jgi:hypothetical protein